jgi:hypothetical protein
MSTRGRDPRPRASGLVLAAALALGVACAGGEPTGTWPEIRPDVPSELPHENEGQRGRRQVPSTVPPAVDGTAPASVTLEGVWVAPPCGRRNYERRLELVEGGVARLEERISPCPPGASCVWSGVEVVEGSWERQDGEVALRLDEVARAMAVEPPDRLGLESRAGTLALVEDGGCRYRRAEASDTAPAPAPSAPPDAEPAPGP